jgi:HEPN domain-containing protein
VPPDAQVPGSAVEWLSFARSDLALGRAADTPGVRFESLCYQLQQAAEKAVKAVCQHHSLRFRYTHDLEDLGAGLERNGLSVPEEVREAATLTEYVLETRYPGTAEPVTEEEYREAVRLAEAVVRWAEETIQR